MSDISKLLHVISRAVRRVKFETILKQHEWYLCQISHTNLAIYLFILLPAKLCNFHMQVFQIKLKYYCSKPIKLQKFFMQQYKVPYSPREQNLAEIIFQSSFIKYTFHFNNTQQFRSFLTLQNSMPYKENFINWISPARPSPTFCILRKTRKKVPNFESRQCICCS